MGGLISGTGRAMLDKESTDNYQLQAEVCSLPGGLEKSPTSPPSPTTMLTNCPSITSSEAGSTTNLPCGMPESAVDGLPSHVKLGFKFGFSINELLHPVDNGYYKATSDEELKSMRIISLDRNALYYKRMRQWLTKHKTVQVLSDEAPRTFVVPLDVVEEFLESVKTLSAGGQLRYIPSDVRAKIIDYFQNQGGNIAKVYSDSSYAMMHYGIGPFKRKEGHSILFLFEGYDLVEAKETLQAFNQRGFKLFIEKTGPDALAFRARFDVN